MLRVTGLLHVPEEAPLVQLVKDLAFDLDDGGGKEVYAKYLSALKDVRRVLAYSARPSSSADPAPTSSEPERDESVDTEAAPVNSLADFRKQRGIG